MENNNPPVGGKLASDFKSSDDLLKATTEKSKNVARVKPILPPSKLKQLNWNPVTSQGITSAEYNVPIDSVYERLNDGSYVAKFENYLGAEGNENRLANQQGTGEKFLYGIGKNLTKVGTYALDATVGTVAGIYNGLSKGSFSAVWDNEFSKGMDDINKRLDYNLPNYYSDEEKANGLLAAIPGFGAANFWFNDVAGGLAFVGGAILPEIGIAALTGGASAAGSFAKLGLKGTSTAIAKELAQQSAKKATTSVGRLLSKADDAVKFSEGRSILRGMSKSVLGSRVGGIFDTGAFLVRTSNFEAGMEARHNFKESVDTYMNSFEDINGRQPTYEELSKFMTSAKNGANTVYAANMAILSVSNAAMFGKTFDITNLPFDNKLIRGINSVADDYRYVGKGVTNFFNKAIGLGVTTLDDGTRILQKANKFQRVAGTTYKILEKPLVEGLFEEGLQGVAGKAMQKSMESLYDLDNSHSESMWSSLTDAFAEQYGSKEGWKEIGIGMIIGFAGGGIQPGGIKSGTAFSGFGKNSYASTRKAMESDLATANEGLTNLRKTFGDVSAPKGVTLLRAMTKASSASASRYDNTTPGFDDMNVNLSFIQSQEHIKTQGEIQEDFEMVVDAMEISKEEQEQLQKSGLTVEQYKQSMINEFAQTSRDYLQAKAVVEALRVPDGVQGGNLMNLKEAMIRNIVIGKQAQKNAQAIGRSIEETTGINGLFSAVEFYNGLDENKKKATAERKDLGKEKEELFNTITQIQTKIAENKTSPDNPKAKAKSLEDQRKYLAATQRMAELDAKITELDEAIERGKSTTKDVAAVSDTDVLSSLRVSTTKEAIEQLDKLDAYINDLENQGRTQEAAALRASLLEYKAYANAHREFMNMHRRMTDTNFFNGEEGRSLLAKVFGKPYSMDPAFYDELKKNDQIIDKALKYFGETGSYESAADQIKKVLKDNPDLSDREKYRIEQMVRIQLQGILAQQVTNTLTSISQTVEAVQEKPTSNILEGDSIQLRTALNLKVNEQTSLQIINEAIQTITSQIDVIQNTVRDTSKIEELTQQLEELKKQRDNYKETSPQEETTAAPQEPTYNSVEEQALAQMKRDLEEEENSLGRSQEVVDQLKADITALEEQVATLKTLSGIDGDTTTPEFSNEEVTALQNDIATLTDEDLQEASQEALDTVYDTQETFDNSVDELITQRREKYGIQATDPLSEIPNDVEVSLSRAEEGKPISPEAIEKIGEYFYSVYKNLVDLKKTHRHKERIALGLTIEDIEQNLNDIAQTLIFLNQYETVLKSQENVALPIFEYNAEFKRDTKPQKNIQNEQPISNTAEETPTRANAENTAVRQEATREVPSQPVSENTS